jgi:hypothetical protein
VLQQAAVPGSQDRAQAVALVSLGPVVLVSRVAEVLVCLAKVPAAPV